MGLKRPQTRDLGSLGRSLSDLVLCRKSGRLVVWLLVLGSAASVQPALAVVRSSPQDIPQPDRDQALLVAYHPTDPHDGVKSTNLLFLNDTFIAAVGEECYAYALVEPGEALLWSDGLLASRLIEIEGGRFYAVRVNAREILSLRSVEDVSRTDLVIEMTDPKAEKKPFVAQSAAETANRFPSLIAERLSEDAFEEVLIGQQAGSSGTVILRIEFPRYEKAVLDPYIDFISFEARLIDAASHRELAAVSGHLAFWVDISFLSGSMERALAVALAIHLELSKCGDDDARVLPFACKALALGQP